MHQAYDAKCEKIFNFKTFSKSAFAAATKSPGERTKISNYYFNYRCIIIIIISYQQSTSVSFSHSFSFMIAILIRTQTGIRSGTRIKLNAELVDHENVVHIYLHITGMDGCIIIASNMISPLFLA